MKLVLKPDDQGLWQYFTRLGLLIVTRDPEQTRVHPIWLASSGERQGLCTSGTVTVT